MLGEYSQRAKSQTTHIHCIHTGLKMAQIQKLKWKILYRLNTDFPNVEIQSSKNKVLTSSNHLCFAPENLRQMNDFRQLQQTVEDLIQIFEVRICDFENYNKDLVVRLLTNNFF